MRTRNKMPWIQVAHFGSSTQPNDRSRHLAAAARVEIPHSVGRPKYESYELLELFCFFQWHTSESCFLLVQKTDVDIGTMQCPSRRHSIATGSIRACGSCRPLLGSHAQFCQHSAIWSRWFWLAMSARSFHIEIVLKWALVERPFFVCRDLEQLGRMVNWNGSTLQTIKCSVGV